MNPRDVSLVEEMKKVLSELWNYSDGLVFKNLCPVRDRALLPSLFVHDLTRSILTK